MRLGNRSNGREMAEIEALTDFQNAKRIFDRAQEAREQAERIEAQSLDQLSGLRKELRRISER